MIIDRNPPTRDTIERAIRILSKVQFLAPLGLLVIAMLVPLFVDLKEFDRNMLIGLLCWFALLEFILFKFVVIPRLKKQLDETP